MSYPRRLIIPHANPLFDDNADYYQEELTIEQVCARWAPSSAGPKESEEYYLGHWKYLCDVGLVPYDNNVGNYYVVDVYVNGELFTTVHNCSAVSTGKFNARPIFGKVTVKIRSGGPVHGSVTLWALVAGKMNGLEMAMTYVGCKPELNSY